MDNIWKKIKACMVSNVWFHIFATFAICLITGSFFVPPMGVIDASVLAAVGEVFAFAALWTVIKGMDEGHTATLTHNNTSLTIDKDEDNDKEEE